MAKKIFIVSSGKAYDKAEEIAAILAEQPDIEPALWREEFKSGDITFTRIAKVAGEVAGAVVVASPDDRSTIQDESGNEQAVSVPRANVLFEYGFFVSALGLSRVMLCRYQPAYLPSDLAGVTHIDMGKWPMGPKIDAAKKLRIKTWARELPPQTLGELKLEIAHYEQRLRELRATYQDALDGKVEFKRRNLWFQLDVLEEKLKDAERASQPAELCILGVNATGPLHQGRELLLRLLNYGGKLRLLLLDPTHVVFQRRSDDEHDSVGRITAELNASLYILMDIVFRVRSSNSERVPNVEIRLHDQYPMQSLLMFNPDREDGIVLDNPYPAEKGKRGVEGEMYPLVQRGRTSPGYKYNLENFRKLWDSARSVALVERATRLQIAEWPFRRPDTLETA